MRIRKTGVLIASAAMIAAVVASGSGFAQYIPPHSNDPHPPANQPAYQLPSPTSRPGLPQYPGAAHSNDPHYTRTIPQPVSPVPQTDLPGSSYPSILRDQLRQFNYQTGPRRNTKAKKREPVSIEQCYAKWFDRLGMTRASWEATCRRLAKEGRLG